MFSKKVVIVTGASSGIGAEIAESFAREGARLTITGRNAENLEETARKCSVFSGGKPLTIVGDVTQEAHLKDIVSSTVKAYEKIDVLVNNAGFASVGSIKEITVENFNNMFDTNLKSVVFLTQLALPHLIQTKGNIINISSIAGIRPAPGTLAYSMSKAALDQFTKTVALELAPSKVRVNSINPGYIPTNIVRGFPMSEEQKELMENTYKNVVPLGRNGSVEDVANAALYLASDKASFITGHLLPMDGGRGLVTPRPDFK